MPALNKLKPDIQAIRIARQIHQLANAEQTFLFGSRARGDHRPNSDIDVLVVKEERQPESWLESLRQHARDIQKTQMPEASGIDIICMTESEFTKGRVFRNHMASAIIKEGHPIMPDERVGCGTGYEDERIDWDDVDKKLTDATGAATWINAIQSAGIIDVGDDPVRSRGSKRPRIRVQSRIGCPRVRIPNQRARRTQSSDSDGSAQGKPNHRRERTRAR